MARLYRVYRVWIEPHKGGARNKGSVRDREGRGLVGPFPFAAGSPSAAGLELAQLYGPADPRPVHGLRYLSGCVATAARVGDFFRVPRPYSGHDHQPRQWGRVVELLDGGIRFGSHMARGGPGAGGWRPDYLAPNAGADPVTVDWALAELLPR